MTLVLVPQDEGLSTAAVYGELDRLRGYAAPAGGSGPPDVDPLRALAAGPTGALAACIANDLQPAALSLRPELAEPIDQLRAAGALAAQVTGSGPTTFGLFADRAAAERAAAAIDENRAAARAATAGAPPPTVVTGLLG
jgi:4-diphosphocytidyl-2-C-methyl-D-erythritol kinase